eukprot:Clim_evm197s157 gene=Clim_evmTU197s157
MVSLSDIFDGVEDDNKVQESESRKGVKLRESRKQSKKGVENDPPPAPQGKSLKESDRIELEEILAPSEHRRKFKHSGIRSLHTVDEWLRAVNFNWATTKSEILEKQIALEPTFDKEEAVRYFDRQFGSLIAMKTIAGYLLMRYPKPQAQRDYEIDVRLGTRKKMTKRTRTTKGESKTTKSTKKRASKKKESEEELVGVGPDLPNPPTADVENPKRATRGRKPKSPRSDEDARTVDKQRHESAAAKPKKRGRPRKVRNPETSD